MKYIALGITFWFVAGVIFFTGAQNDMKVGGLLWDMAFYIAIAGCIILPWPLISKKFAESRAMRIPEELKGQEKLAGGSSINRG